jgi:hypothetical protein
VARSDVSATANETRETHTPPTAGAVNVSRLQAATSMVSSAFREGGIMLEESSPAEQVAAWRLLEPTNLWRRSALTSPNALASLAIESEQPTRVRVDGVELGITPVRVALSPGHHRVARIDEKSEQLEMREVGLKSGETATLTFSSPVASAAPSVTPGANLAVGGALPKELLLTARRHAADGDWRAAAAAYRELAKRFPRSAEAHTVLVALGDIERLRLANPAAALRAYDAYLRVGGPLAQEARSGKVRALRALGKAVEERAALRAYLQAHPRGVEAQAFRERLEALQ